jgi:hypothetical protein
MRAYGGVDAKIHIFLTSALAEGEWSASRPGCFITGETASGNHWTGGRENCWPYSDSKSNLSVVQPLACRYADCADSVPFL